MNFVKKIVPRFLLTFPLIFRHSINIVIIYVFAKFLQVEAFGLLNLSLVYTQLLTMFISLCLGSGFVRYFYEINDDIKKTFVNSYFQILLIILIFNSIIVLILKDFIFPNNINFNYIILILLIAICKSISEFVLLYFRYMGKLKLFKLGNYSAPIFLIFLATFLVLYNHFTVTIVLVLLTSQYFFLVLFFIIKVFQLNIFKSVKFILNNKKIYYKTFLFSLFIIPGNLGYFINDMTDKLLLNKFLTLNDVGIYSFTYQYSFLIIFVLTKIIQVNITPYILKNYREKFFETKINNIVLLFSIFFAGSFLFFIGFSTYFFKFINPQYIIGIQYVPILIIACFFALFSQLFVMKIHIAEKSHYDSFIELGSGILNFILCFIFIETYGVIAAVYSTLISFAVRCAFYYIIGKRLYKGFDFNLKPIFLSLLFMLVFNFIFLNYYV